MVPLIPREVLFGNPERASPRLAPDGSALAFLAPLDGVLNLWVRDLASGVERPVTRDPGRGVQAFAWAEDDRHLLYVQDRNGDENWRLYALAPGEPGADGNEVSARDLTPREGVQARLLAVEARAPHEVLVALNERDPELHDVYRIDLRSGARTLVAQNDLGAIGWHVDHALRVRLALLQDPAGGLRLLHRRDDAGPWRESLSWDQEDAFGTAPLAFAGDDETVYLTSSLGADTSGLVAWRSGTGQCETLARDPRADLSRVLFHPATHKAEAVAFTHERERWTFLDPAVGADFARLGALMDGDWDVVSRDRHDRGWVASCVGDRAAAAYFLYDRQATRDDRPAAFLFSTRPRLEPYTLAEMRPVRVTARDGLEIHGYLTLPPGENPRQLPAVLNVHGGPWARDCWGYDAEAQWLANRGYACLQLNYRGSSGYGKRFLNAANRDWGGAMQDDLTDGLRWLVEQGIADPRRFAIYGGSYGGYAVLRGMTSTPELFACGVDIVGPSNLVTFLESIPPYWKPMRALFDRHVGHPERDAQALRASSPLYQVDRIRAPLLIAQGANDPRVKREESLQIVDALRAAGKEVRYLEFADEGHGFVRPPNRLRFYAEAERFLAEHLGGRVEE